MWELAEHLLGSETSAIGLVKMGIQTNDRGLLPFYNAVLVGIIEIESKPIHCGYNWSHTGRWKADEHDAAINQYILNEHAKHGAMSQAIQNHSQGVERKIAHQHLTG